MITLGIDQSFTSTGIVVKDRNTVLHFSTIRSDKNHDIYQRAFDIKTKVVEIVQLYKPTLINIEQIAFGGVGNAAKNLAGLLFLIMCDIQTVKHYDVNLVSPTSLKKFATDSGRASKKQMINALPAAVLKMFEDGNYKLTTGLSDLADAYWLACYE